jgi:antitoxin component YwqK of YwqJK toxin-antitoxin module
VDGKFHNFYRIWHRNGQLAQELSYRNGLLHGASREWDENGCLARSQWFTCNGKRYIV